MLLCVKKQHRNSSYVPHVTSDCNTDPVPLLLVLQHPHLLLQPLAFPLQLLLPLARPLGLAACALQLRLQLLELQVRQGVQAAGALKGQGRTVQHCEEEQRQSQPTRRLGGNKGCTPALEPERADSSSLRPHHSAVM